jgi:hypothetical protein
MRKIKKKENKNVKFHWKIYNWRGNFNPRIQKQSPRKIGGETNIISVGTI